MEKQKSIWVLPEITGDDSEISSVSLGLLSEARSIADKVGGAVTALLFGEQYHDFAEIFGKYGVNRSYFFQDPLFKYPSAEVYAAAVLPQLQNERPWLLLLAYTTIGRELAPRLAAALNTGLVSDCVRIDLSESGITAFYRPVFGGQLYQEVVFETPRTMMVTMNPDVLTDRLSATTTTVDTQVIESHLAPEAIKMRHLEYFPADFQQADVTDAETIVAAGMGASTDEILPMVEELAALLEGAIGTTQPVVDSGKIPRERLIGQTGKIVSPDFYLALGISGATQHIGGIQDSRKIVAVNRDPLAPVFRSSDLGLCADLKDVLPKLITRIKKAKESGEIL